MHLSIQTNRQIYGKAKTVTETKRRHNNNDILEKSEKNEQDVPYSYK